MAAPPCRLRQDRGLSAPQAGSYRPLSRPGCRGTTGTGAGPGGSQERPQGLTCSETQQFQRAQARWEAKRLDGLRLGEGWAAEASNLPEAWKPRARSMPSLSICPPRLCPSVFLRVKRGSSYNVQDWMGRFSQAWCPPIHCCWACWRQGGLRRSVWKGGDLEGSWCCTEGGRRGDCGKLRPGGPLRARLFSSAL